MQFPLQLRFKMFALASQIVVTDANGGIVYFVKSKAFKLKEDIRVYGDESQQDEKYTIKSDRVVNFSASHAFATPDGRPLGSIRRKGMRSIWRASYEIWDASDNIVMTITEESPWLKVADAIVKDIPVVGIFAGYIIKPSYVVKDMQDELLLRVAKTPSLLDRRFECTQLRKLEPKAENLAVLGALQMIVLERTRG